MNTKENLLEVLLDLFENINLEETKPNHPPDPTATNGMIMTLSSDEVYQMVQWLKALMAEPPSSLASTSIRVYSTVECEKLNRDCRGFLLSLEQIGVLTPVVRELVVNYVMSLDTRIALEQLKLVILMALSNQPNQETALAWMEKMFYEEFTGYPAH